MTLTNKRTPDGEIEYVNGEIGVVEAVEDGDDAVVQVRLDRGATVSVQRAEWSQYEYYLEYDANSCRQVIRQNEVGKFVQMPLKLSYATTINKAQGLSLDYVSVKLGNGCFAHGSTIREAIEDAMEKYYGNLDFLDFDEAKEKLLAEFEEKGKLTVKELYQWHGILTGSCRFGRSEFQKQHNLKDDDLLSLEEFVKLTEDAFNGEKIRALMD